MNNKLAKQLRKHVKETMANNAQWAVYDTKVVTRPTVLNFLGEVGESVTHVKSLVKGCGRQRYKQMKKMYKQMSQGGLV